MQGGSYCEKFLTRPALERLESGAFEQLVKHLQERNEEVQNIDLMTVSGFCRNCLAKVCSLIFLANNRKVTDSIDVSDEKISRFVFHLNSFAISE